MRFGVLVQVSCLALAVFLCGAPRPAAAAMEADREALLQGYEARIRAILARGGLPIIDVEHHWSGDVPLGDLLAAMDRNDVALTWLGQKERNGSAFVWRYVEQAPDRIVPVTIHGDGPRWHAQDPTLLTELAADVRSGRYFAMGEFEARHYISSTNDRDVHLPADSEPFEAVFRLSEEIGMPFLVHHEAEDVLLPELERMLTRHPRATVIWCHVGRDRNRETWTILPRPEGVRAFLLKYPNLFFDLNQARPGSRHRGTNQVDSVLYDIDPTKGGRQTDARLNDEWKELFEEFPDRFLIGSDISTKRFDRYDQVMGNFRHLILNHLDRDAAEKIAWKNAWRLMSGREWRER